MAAAAATSLSAGFDPTDVPAADPEHLARLLRILVRQGDGLMMLRGADAASLRAVETAFWAELDADTASGIAAIVRFRAVIDAFAARKLRALLLNEGLPALARVLRVAAALRLNASRGFSPHHLLWGVAADAARIPPLRSPQRRSARVIAAEPVAA